MSSLEGLAEPCWPIEDLVAFATGSSLQGELSQEKELAQHLESCALCLHEVEVARAALNSPRLDSGVDPMEQRDPSDNRVLVIVEQLETAPAWQKPRDQGSASRDSAFRGPASSAKILPFPRRFLVAVQLAAAAALVAVGFSTWLDPAPQLPMPGGVVTRGAALTIKGPVGTLAELPSELQWQHSEQASLYIATLRNVRQEVLFECQVESAASSVASCPLGSSVSLEPFVRYSWRVIGYGAKDKTEDDVAPAEVARSPWIFFSFETP